MRHHRAAAAPLCLLVLASGCWEPGPEADAQVASASAISSSGGAAHEGLLYGRVTTSDGDVLEGPLRLGGDRDALWGHYFNGFRDENPWVPDELREQLPKTLDSISVFGVPIARRERDMNLRRPFMARFGDIARIERTGNDIRVTLKSGTESVLDRMAADDFGYGVRVWNDSGGFVDLGERQIRSIDLLPTARIGQAPLPLHGTVRGGQRDFTGFIQWNREESLGSDALPGLGLPFDSVRSIAHRGTSGPLVTMLDGREVELPSQARPNLGVYVDDPRYGRVLVSWDAFQRVDFGPGGTGPAYDDFPTGGPLTGSVVARSGRRIQGRLIYDLDESETTETLDAPFQGVNFTIPFGLIASIELPGPDQRGAEPATVTLHGGEAVALERAGDLGPDNGGLLVFPEGRPDPEYVPWSDVTRIDLDAPPAMYPPSGSR